MTDWKTVVSKKKENINLENELILGPVNSNTAKTSYFQPYLTDVILRSVSQKITEPCWFYNNGGCRNPDGSEKLEKECKYVHEYSQNVKRPVHLAVPKPCDKYNLEGYCKWRDFCKYSHRNLTQEEWLQFYPGIPFVLKTNVQKRLALEELIVDLESRIKILEYKITSMDSHYEKKFKAIYLGCKVE